METNFYFKSSVYTSKEQSERLIALGLKKETADIRGVEGIEHTPTYAWSLGRLWELLGKIKKYEGEDELSYPRISLVEEDVIVENPKSLWVRQSFISPKGVYENIINCLEELIKKGYFPKEYLV